MAKRNTRQQKKIDKQRFQQDSYQNIFLNMGTGGDRSAFSRIGGYRLLSQVELTDIYLSDGIGRRIVDVVADELLRAGFDIEGVDDTKAIFSRWDELNLTPSLNDAFAWSRLYGGSLIVLGINDGGALEDEAREDGELEFIRVYDRFQVSEWQKNIDPESPQFGTVEIYQINPYEGVSYFVHASRCIVIDGERVPNQTRRSNQGWGASVLQGIYEALIRFGMGHQHANSLLERKQQGVWSASKLADLCSDDEGSMVVRRRLNLVDMARSVGNSIAIDAETEKYELLNGDVSGVTDVLKEFKNLICAMTGIDEQVLFTTTPTGQGSDKVKVPENWKQLIGRKQRDEVRPVIERLVSLLTDKPTWTIKFNPLAVPSEADVAATNNAQSQADDRYAAIGVIGQNELRDTLRKRGAYVMTDDDLPEPVDEE